MFCPRGSFKFNVSALLHASCGNQPYKSPKYSTKVKDCPESEDVTTLRFFWRIAHHNLALCTPEYSSAAAEKEARKDDIAFILGVIVTQIC